MAFALYAGPAAARVDVQRDPGLAYVQARAASMLGDHAASAELLTALAEAQPNDVDIAKKALSEAIGSGQIDLALRLIRAVPAQSLSSEARLLMVADEIRRRRPDRAFQWLAIKGETGDLTFLDPLVRAWTAAERGDLNGSLGVIDQMPANSLLGPLRAEQRAFILLKFKRTADAEPFARRAIGTAGPREIPLRLALADAFRNAGDMPRAQIMLEGMGAEAPAMKQRLLSGRLNSERIENLAQAYSEALTAFAGDIARSQRSAPPVGLVQVARYADPKNSSAALLLAVLLDGRDRTNEALALLNSIPKDDALAGEVRDVQVRLLADDKRFNDAYAIAATATRDPNAGVADYTRLGDLYSAMDRYGEAADAYGRAITLARAQGLGNELWTLMLLSASALEQANRWPEARNLLQQALAIAPDQPSLLNFLGYGKLERGEDLDAAEALIRKASELSPDDASITDSLGWAQYKRGKLAEAVTTLQQAAERDPDQAEIQEHLGDALYKSGRRYEARFAWNAALAIAEDEIAQRVRAKLLTGLTSANGAP